MVKIKVMRNDQTCALAVEGRLTSVVIQPANFLMAASCDQHAGQLTRQLLEVAFFFHSWFQVILENLGGMRPHVIRPQSFLIFQDNSFQDIFQYIFKRW